MRRLRVWHFVLLPALGMGAVLLLARAVAALLPSDLGPAARTAFQIGRTAAIAVGMSSLIGWLAVRHRRDYEAALERTRDFLTSVIDGCGEAIVTLDAADRITSWNRAAERIFGWKAAEMLGRGFDVLLPPDAALRGEREAVARQLRAGHSVRDHVTTRLRADGAPIVVRITWSPLGTPAAYGGATAIVLDITEETEMRRRLVEQERLAAVGELAAQVAHEVRNPLAGIRGACEIMVHPATDPERRRQVATELSRQIDRLSRTVTELLQFSRPVEPRPEPVDLHELLEQVCRRLLDDPQSTALEVERDYSSGLPPVLADPLQLDQVFYNLVLNAAQAMEFRGTIRLRTQRTGPRVEARVSDTGPGFRPEIAAQLFQPFFTTRAQGTGLGLAIVKRILTAHGGTIEARAAAGGGAEFCVHLPIAPS
ncbi:MAG TPA: ATP-binding protein [Candidatus Polarisedimenticolaceae bacterium]|nr:ATP-binding protein [Candidatus Polarisedimenticolaceae bacterium]